MFVSCSIAGTASAQFTLSGELRPRTEYRHGYQTLLDSAQGAGVFTSQRTRLNFGYAAENFRTSLVLQDVRVWGSQPQLNAADGLSSLHEAWGEYTLCRSFSVKAGRQELNYNDERLLGATAWVQQARSHDALLVKYSDSTLTAHAGAAYNQGGETSFTVPYAVGGSYKEMYFMWINKKVAGFNISLIGIGNGMQSKVSAFSTWFSRTAGTYIEYKKDNLFVCGRYYNQGGVDADKKKIEAFMAGADVNYMLLSRISVGVGGEMMSGQSATDTSKSYMATNRSFSALYGTGHKFNGYMDYYYAGNPHGGVGLQDIYFKTKFKADKWWAGLDAHIFNAAANVLDKKKLASDKVYSSMNPYLGAELDITAAYTFSPEFSLQCGYSQYLPTASTGSVKKGKYNQTQNWAYLMLTFKPVFVK